MYKYLSRAPCRRCKDSGSFARGRETVLKNDHPSVRSSQAFSVQGRINNSGTRYAQLQIINALHLGQRDRAEEMLRGFICLNASPNANDFDDILEYCAQIADPLFVMEAWKVMVKNEVDMTKRSYRYVIQAFSKGGYFKEVFGWLTSLEGNDNFRAVLPLCNIILKDCVNRQSLKDVGSCLDLMDSRLMGKSEITYWELLKHSVMQKSLIAVHDVWKDCIKHYTPSIMMLRKFVWSFTRLHDLESAYKVLQFMVTFVKGKCSSVRKSAAGRYQSSRLDIPIPAACKLSDEAFRLKENEHLESVFNSKSIIEENNLGALDISAADESSSNGIAYSLLAERDIADACFDPSTIDAVSSGIHRSRFPDDAEKKGYTIPKAGETVPFVNVLRWSFNDVIQYCAQSGTWKLAELLFFQMQALGVEPSPHSYDGLVKAVTHGKGLFYGMELLESMKRSMKPCNDTLAFLSVEHSKNLDLNMAAHFLEMISDNSPKYIHPFNAFMVACDIMDEPERAIHMLAKIKHLNIKPNIRTYELLISLFANVNAPYERGTWPSHLHAAERIRHIEWDMMRNGVKHSNASMKNLIRALGAEGMITEMLQRLEVAENMLLAMEPHEITDLYNIVLHALVEAKDSSTTIEYYKRMRSCGFLADAATYQIMIECCSLITCFKSALSFTSLMLREGFFPQIVAYTALVKVLLAADDFEGALDLLNQTTSEPIQLDVQLFNEILQHACTRICSEEMDDDCAKAMLLLDVIELVIEQMHRAKLKPDPSTCTYTFLAYVELGFHSTAVEALRVMSLHMISKDNDDLLEKRDSFADLVCSEDPDVESIIVSIFKGTEDYVAVALLNLRWCTFITGHPVSWSPGESLWAQRLSSSYMSRKGDAVRVSL